jgi:hypothetical protein
MSPRVTSDLLLVGSIPAASTEDALRTAAANFAGPGLVFALPDGETGPRSSWAGYGRERLVRPNPDIETVKETDSPTGRPRHMCEAPVFRVRPGAAAVHPDTWPRVDDAIASYRVFRKLRAAGVIPAGVRFQVGLPFPVVLRHVPRVADVRGAGHGRPGQDGELRGRELRPRHRLGAHGRRATCAARMRASSARSPDCGQGREDLPRHRAAAGRRAGAATAAGHRGEVPAGLRRRAVLRLPRPARQHPGQAIREHRDVVTAVRRP